MALSELQVMGDEHPKAWRSVLGDGRASFQNVTALKDGKVCWFYLTKRFPSAAPRAEQLDADGIG